MVDELQIDQELKGKLKKTLKKFPTLFGGGLGKLSDEFPRAKIKLKEGAKPHAATYYTLPHTQRDPARKSISIVVGTGINMFEIGLSLVLCLRLHLLLCHQVQQQHKGLYFIHCFLLYWYGIDMFKIGVLCLRIHLGIFPPYQQV